MTSCFRNPGISLTPQFGPTGVFGDKKRVHRHIFGEQNNFWRYVPKLRVNGHLFGNAVDFFFRGGSIAFMGSLPLCYHWNTLSNPPKNFGIGQTPPFFLSM